MATSNLTFAGNAVTSDATFTSEVSLSYSVAEKGFVINIPAGLATVITIH